MDFSERDHLNEEVICIMMLWSREQSFVYGQPPPTFHSAGGGCFLVLDSCDASFHQLAVQGLLTCSIRWAWSIRFLQVGLWPLPPSVELVDLLGR